RPSVLTELRRIRDSLDSIGNARGDDPVAWIPAVMNTCSGLASLIDAGHLAGDAADTLADALAVLWAAGAVARQIAEWSSNTREDVIQGLDETVTPSPSPSIAT